MKVLAGRLRAASRNSASVLPGTDGLAPTTSGNRTVWLIATKSLKVS
ncbi:Uncharacterised protein [Bordetella pertussis]|nr:Uncharacterised protein [Bordetella pertussis]